MIPYVVSAASLGTILSIALYLRRKAWPLLIGAVGYPVYGILVLVPETSAMVKSWLGGELVFEGFAFGFPWVLAVVLFLLGRKAGGHNSHGDL